MISATRSVFAALVGAFILFGGMLVVAPSQLEVRASDPLGGFETVVNAITGTFSQLAGSATNGALCAKSDGIEYIRANIDKALVSKQRGGSPYHLTTRLIACMVSTVPGDGAPGKEGYVVYYGKKLVDGVSKRFVGILSALALLAVSVYGIRVALGYGHELQSAGFILVFKIGFLLLALNSMPMLYTATLNTMNQMAGTIAAAIPTDMCPEVEAAKAKFKSAPGGDRTFLLPWVKLDCSIESIATIVQNSEQTMVGTMVTAFLSDGMGKGVATAFFAGVFTLFSVLNLAMFIVVLANLALVLMFMIAPLCWVCIMFKATNKYFQKWMTLTMGFAMQPVLLALFLMMRITAFEQVICKQPFSVGAVFNAIKANAITQTTDPSTGDISYQARPRLGAHYGKEHCTRDKVQDATRNMIDGSNPAGIKNTVIPATSDLTQDSSFMDNANTLFKNISGGWDLGMFAKVVKGEGFTMNKIDFPQIYKKYVSRLGLAFQALLGAFAVLFILYAFLKQLPSFINQLASSAVTSGNLTQVKMQPLAQQGMKRLDQMTGDFNVGAMGSFGGIRQGLSNIGKKGE